MLSSSLGMLDGFWGRMVGMLMLLFFIMGNLLFRIWFVVDFTDGL